MGQTYSSDSPLLRHNVPLTTSQATNEAEKITNHLQSNRQKALASLFLCATEEYQKSNEDLVKEGIIDENINNCDAILSSIGAARFCVSDAIDCFPHWKKDPNRFAPTADSSSSSASSQNPFSQLNDDDIVNDTPIGYLGVFSSISLSPDAHLCHELGDQRPWLNALCTGNVFVSFVRDTARDYYYSADSLGGGQTNVVTRLLDFVSTSNDAEAVLKLGLHGKENSVNFSKLNTARLNLKGFNYRSHQRTAQELNQVMFDDEPVTRQFDSMQGGIAHATFSRSTITTALAGYLLQIALCTSSDSETLTRYNSDDDNENDRGGGRYKSNNIKFPIRNRHYSEHQKRYIRDNSYYGYGYHTGNPSLAQREIVDREKLRRGETFCGLQLTPAELLPLLPNLSQFLPPCEGADLELYLKEKEKRWASNNKYFRYPPSEITSTMKQELLVLRSFDECGEVDKNDNKQIHHQRRLTGYPVEYFLLLDEQEEIDAESKIANRIIALVQAASRSWSSPNVDPLSLLRSQTNHRITQKRFIRRFFLRQNPLAPIDHFHDRLLCLGVFAGGRSSTMELVKNNEDDELTPEKFANRLLFKSSNNSDTVLNSIANEPVGRISAAARLRMMSVSSSSPSYSKLLIHPEVFAAEIGPSIGNATAATFCWPAPTINIFDPDHTDKIPRLQQTFPDNIYDEESLLLFRDNHRVAAGQPCFCTQQVFQEKWNKFSQGILDGYHSSSHAWVVGGAVAQCLDPSITDANAMPPSTNRDIDIAFVGLSPVGVLREIQNLDRFLREKFTTVRTRTTTTSAHGETTTNNNTNKELSLEMLTCATSKTLTYVFPYPLPRIQVMLGQWNSIGEMLMFNDVDACGVAMNLGGNKREDDIEDDHNDDRNTNISRTSSQRYPTAVCTPRSLFAWMYKLSFVTEQAHQDRGSPNYEMRLLKYSRRFGFAVVHPTIRGPQGFHNTIWKRLKQVEKDQEDGKTEKIRMTLSSGLTWLYFVQQGKFKPKLDVPSALDVSPTRGLKEVQEQVLDESYAESDNYGGEETGFYLISSRRDSLFRSIEEEDRFYKKSVNENLWRNDLLNGHNTTAEYGAPRSQLGLSSKGGAGYSSSPRGGGAVTHKRYVALFHLQIGHEKYVETERWTVDLEKDEEDELDDNDFGDSDFDEEEEETEEK